MSMPRRQFLQAAAALGTTLALPPHLQAAPQRKETRIDLVPSAFATVLDAEAPVRTGVWSYNEQFPGPLLRLRRGDKVHARVTNQLSQETTVHWHGVRVPNSMDGVPNVTQLPIAVGGGFDYHFAVRDSGTYWYHPHQSSYEQVPRGLYGALIVAEERPPQVDRDEVWVLSDIRLDEHKQQVEDFGRILDFANDGRLGNQTLVNGQVAGMQRRLAVRAGERLRLRLINAASARIFRLALDGHAASIIAYDGQAVAPHPLPQDGLLLGPGMRVDLIVDCLGQPGQHYALRDLGRPPAAPAILAALAYSTQGALRNKPLASPIALEPNQIAEPDLSKATDHYIMFQGGMRGAPVVGMVDGRATRIHEIMATQGLAWTMNFNAQHEHALMHEPLLYLQAGEHVILHLINETDFVHPMHLHGHFFRVLAIDGKPTPLREWRDTVLMGPRQTVDVAFVADNPGEWMFHCHILDHAAGGMMGTIAVE